MNAAAVNSKKMTNHELKLLTIASGERFSLSGETTLSFIFQRIEYNLVEKDDYILFIYIIRIEEMHVYKAETCFGAGDCIK